MNPATPSEPDSSFPLQILYRLAKLVTSDLDLSQTLDAIVDAVSQQLDEATSAAIVVQDDTGDLVIRAGRGAAAAAIGQPGQAEAGVIRRALLEARPVVIADLQALPPRMCPAVDLRAGVRAYLVAPLVWRGDTLGVLSLGGAAPDLFNQADLPAITEMADLAAAAVVRAREQVDERARHEQMEALGRSLSLAQQRLLQVEEFSVLAPLAQGIARELTDSAAVMVSGLSAARGASAATIDAARQVGRIGEALAALAPAAQSDPAGPAHIERIVDAAITLAVSGLQHPARIERAFGGVPGVQGRPADLAWAFLHLLVNAIQSFDDPGGLVSVSTSVEHEQVVVRIMDTGRGIAPEHLPRIFDPLFSAGDAGDAGDRGSLGVSVAQRIVARYAGTIDVQSARGNGTTVTVRLLIAS